MKKILMTLTVMLAVSAAYAQKMYVGGGIGLWNNHNEDETVFSISPEFGYGINERWSVGGQLNLDLHAVVGGPDITSFAIAPYARLTLYGNSIVRLFLEMGLGLSVSSERGSDADAGFEIGVKPGVAVNLNDHISFFSKVGFAGFRQDYRGDGNSGFGVGVSDEYISIGIQYTF